MGDTRDQTLTQVQSPLSPGEQRDRAVLLMSGNASTPGLTARARLQMVGDELYLGRRADGLPVQASVAVLDDGLVSEPARAHRARLGRLRARGPGQQERHVRRQRPGATGRTRAARRRAGVHRQPRRRVPHGVVDRARGDEGGAGGAARARWRRCRPRWRWPAIGCAGWPRPRASCSSSARPAWARRSTRAPCTRRAGARAASWPSTAPRIPRELVESELFGYRAGAHSTAHQAQGRPDRGGRGRHAVPRRDRRDDAARRRSSCCASCRTAS